jgi:hypothetical protein
LTETQEFEFHNRFVTLGYARDAMKHIIKEKLPQEKWQEIPDLPGRFYTAKTWCGKMISLTIVENKDKTSICEECLLQSGILWRY